MKCFMKEPRLRSSAEELLLHPWIAQIPKNKVEQSSQLVAENVSSRNDRDALLNTIKLYEKEKHTSVTEVASGGLPIEEEDEENWDDELGFDSAPKPLSLGGVPSGKPAPASSPSQAPLPLKNVFQLSKEDENALFDEDVWDDQDDVPVSAAHQPVATPTAKSASILAAVQRPTLDGLTPLTTSWGGSALVPKEKRLTKLQSFSEKEHDEDLDFDEIDEERLLKVLAHKKASPVSASALQRTNNAASPLDQFNEDDETSFDDMLDSMDNIAHRLSKRDLKTAADTNEAFADFEDELGFDSLRDSNQMATARVVELLALLDPSMDDQVILDACMSLVRRVAAVVCLWCDGGF